MRSSETRSVPYHMRRDRRLGSARASRANARPARTFGASPKQALRWRGIEEKVRNGEGAIAGTRGACAPQTEAASISYSRFN
ncbi:MAG: hypothetical protein QOG67_2837 [Verrucomicrobiota bacterium]